MNSSGTAALKRDIELLKEMLRETRINLRGERVNIVKSKINTATSKVGRFFKRNVKKIRDSLGLMSLNIKNNITGISIKHQEKKTEKLIKRNERRKILISRVNTVKNKVGSFKKKVVNGFKNAFNKVRDAFRPDQEERARLIEELKTKREELMTIKEHNQALREEGTFQNLKNGGR